jgi:hypothetical protein
MVYLFVKTDLGSKPGFRAISYLIGRGCCYILWERGEDRE